MNHALSHAIEQYRRAQTRQGREQGGLYALEGTRLVERAIRAGVALEAVFISADEDAFHADSRHQTLLAQLPQPPYRVPPSVMASWLQGRGTGEIVALARLPQSPNLADWLAQSAESALLLIADNIIDAGNVGAMIRTAHALSATALIATGVTDPYHPRAVRTSMGSVCKLLCFTGLQLPTVLQLCHGHRYATLAAIAQGGIAPNAFAPSTGRLALIMGNEYHGLSAETLPLIQHHLTIPMSAGIDSLSVNAATAILLYALQQTHSPTP